MINNNMRKHIRYTDVNSTTSVELSWKNEGAGSLTCITALVENESHGGLGCIYLGDPIPPGTLLMLKEAPNLETLYTVVRCVELDANVHRIGLQRADA